MKPTVRALLALAVLAAMVIVTTISKHAVRAVYAQSVCSVPTLSGDYAFSQEGWAPMPGQGNQLPFFNVGVIAFDGRGNFTVRFTNASPRGISMETDVGTYRVNSDCTASISITSGPGAGASFNMVIIGGGAELFGVNTATGFTSSFDAKKQ
jgi:hypothetical protein